MIIETLDDWNAINTGCGCCGMPECPVPVMECESITLEMCGYQLPVHPDVPLEDYCKRFATRTVYSNELQVGTYEGYTTEELEYFQVVCKYLPGATSDDCSEVSFSSEYEFHHYLTQFSPLTPGTITVDQNSSSSLGVACSGTQVSVNSFDPSGDYSLPFETCADCASMFTEENIYNDFFYSAYIYTYSDEFTIGNTVTTTDFSVTYSNLIDPSYIVTLLAGKDFETESNGTSCGSSLYSQVIGDGDGLLCEETFQATRSRVRFQIPVTHTGSWYEITYDIIDEPTGWDDPSPTVFRSFVSQDNVLEWTGPGTGAADDPSWFTDWITIDPPTVPGIRRIVNVRYACYRSTKFGTRPQTLGDGVELPPP